jgi:hypothetical protein
MFEPGQIPQQSGRFRTRRQDAPPSWTAPGSAPPEARRVFFAPPPPLLGAVLQAESELEVGKSPSSGTGLKIVGAILGAPLFGIVTLILSTIILRAMGDTRPDATTPFLALGGAVLGIITGWIVFGRGSGTHTFYACEGGLVRYMVNGSVIEGEVLHFREAAKLHHDITRKYKGASMTVTHDYIWRSADGRKLFAINYVEGFSNEPVISFANSAAMAWGRWSQHHPR